PCYSAFHDEEWGVPVHDDRKLFELLVLSGALAELTWPAILNKRDIFREVFMDFDPLDSFLPLVDVGAPVFLHFRRRFRNQMVWLKQQLTGIRCCDPKGVELDELPYVDAIEDNKRLSHMTASILFDERSLTNVIWDDEFYGMDSLNGNTIHIVQQYPIFFFSFLFSIIFSFLSFFPFFLYFFYLFF
ncbi:hypothetical protein ACJX0J_040885, partial [Zea mays]